MCLEQWPRATGTRHGAGKHPRGRVLPETGLCLFAGMGSVGKPSIYLSAEDGMAGALLSTTDSINMLRNSTI